MRRLFIIRKDLNLKPGKLAAMVGHCCEAYWTNLLKISFKQSKKDSLLDTVEGGFIFPIEIDSEIWDDYINGIFTKTICEAKNLNHLNKVLDIIKDINAEISDPELQLVETRDYGFINDKCLTDLVPENEDGTCTIGIWFKPLNDDIAHKISKKYKLYGVFDK